MEELNDYITQHKLNVVKLAKDLGISFQHLYMIRNGTRKPSLSLALKFDEISGSQVPVKCWKDKQPEGK